MLADSLEAYFPRCTRLDCPRAGRPHADVLPHQRELIESDEQYVCLVGGYGAAKTLAASVLGVLLSLQVPGNSGIVLRRSYPNLKDSTMRTFLDVLQRANIPFKQFEVRDGWPFRIVLPNHSEVVFRESKDKGRKIASEYGWFYIDEAAEEPEAVFNGFAGGRLRLPAAHGYLKGILTTNPPHHQHWIPKRFGAVPGRLVETTVERGHPVETTFRLIKTSTRANPFLPPSYVATLRLLHGEQEAKRIVDGEYGFSFEGSPVLAPPFDFTRHVTTIEPLAMTVVRSWDFGYRHPVITWHQFPKCREDTIHWRIVAEYGGTDIYAEDLVPIVWDRTRARWPDLPRHAVTECGDHAGAQVGNQGPGPIIRLSRKPYGLTFKHRYIPNIDPGLALLRNALRADCPCGQPVLAIDRGCRDTIDAFAGGYHYPTISFGKAQPETTKKPQKDGIYDNFIDSVRYAGENYYRALLRDPRVLEALMERRASDGPGWDTVPAGGPSWAWMN